MAMSVTKGEGVTIITVKSDPKSNCPLVCQLLGSLCYSPVCSVSQWLRILLGDAQSVLATFQILIGLFNIGLGAVLTVSSGWSFLYWIKAPYWLGGIFIVTGIICIFAERFPSLCLVFLCVVANIGSVFIAVAAIVLYSVDLARGQDLWWLCNWQKEDSIQNYYSYYWRTTVSPSVASLMEIEWQKELDLCKNEKYLLMMSSGRIEILLIILAVVQLCVAISASVVSIKALVGNIREGKKDPELSKHLLEEVSTNPDV